MVCTHISRHGYIHADGYHKVSIDQSFKYIQDHKKMLKYFDRFSWYFQGPLIDPPSDPPSDPSSKLHRLFFCLSGLLFIQDVYQ